ncbi:flagellin [Paraburkholderia sp. RCC_158]|uniref:flagellin N-terminal helical domain-containing protein n=1 Tax=Paraburkholderia sp. RCC_158 TaxID=3239220 RepID=UPI0035244415
MLGINSNINSLVAQQNLSGSQSALSQAITRLSSGKRINSAADDAAGLAISTGMQTQINGLNQGVSNANDGVSMIQTATSGLAQITSSLQRIRTLAVQASNGGLTADNQAALQQEVQQQIAEVNRIASQTTYNGKSVLDGSAGTVNFQVGANVGQSISLNLSQNVSAASMGGGYVQKGATLGTITGLNLDATTGAAPTSVAAGQKDGVITSINIQSDGAGGFTYTDQNNKALTSAASSALFSTTQVSGVTTLSLATSTDLSSPSKAITDISSANATGLAAGTVLGTVSNISVDAGSGKDVTAGTAGAVTGVTVKSDGSGGFQFFDQNGGQLSAGATAGLFAVSGTAGSQMTLAAGTVNSAPASTLSTAIKTLNLTNAPTSVANIDISSKTGANIAIESIDNALTTVNNIQATLGAAQNRFTAIATTQQAQSTDLAQAQSNITDANFAQETANLSKAQVLQQAGISVLSQANSLPQQVLKLLQ